MLLLFIGSVSLSKRVRYLTLGTWEFPFLADTECERGAFGNVRIGWNDADNRRIGAWRSTRLQRDRNRASFQVHHVSAAGGKKTADN